MEANKQIADIVRQERLLAELKQQGLVDPDIYITRSSTLAEQLRTAKLEKERFLESEEDQTIRQTQVLLEILETGPEFLEAFDEEPVSYTHLPTLRTSSTPLPHRMPTTQNSSPATRNGSSWTYMRMRGSPGPPWRNGMTSSGS